ncbi:MAG: ABC transporter permease [Lentisphaerae bacterium]|nr:ABC transporter permease [Lentisphaerota bacterium]
MKRIFHLAMKDIAVLMADKGNLFWVFGFPIVYALFFGAIFSGSQEGPSSMTLGIVDEDGSALSRQFVEELDSRETLEVVSFSREEALARVRKGTLSSALFLKPGFGDGLGGLFSGDRNIEMASDPARAMESGFLQGLIVQSLFEVVYKQFTDMDTIRSNLDLWREEIRNDVGSTLNTTIFLGFVDALQLMLEDVELDSADSALSGFNLSIPTVEVAGENKGPENSFQITFPQAMLWGILGCAATFAVSLVRERTVGTMLRLRICPISQAHILAGKGFACFITCLFVIVMLFLGGKFFFHVPINSVPLFFLAAVSITLCFVGIMMMVSTLGRTEQSVGGAGWAIMMVMSMIGGGMVPLVFMPEWLHPFSYASPVRWGIYALEGGIWRGFGFAEMLMPCGILLAIGAVCFVFGLWLMKRFHSVG